MYLTPHMSEQGMANPTCKTTIQIYMPSSSSWIRSACACVLIGGGWWVGWWRIYSFWGWDSATVMMDVHLQSARGGREE